MGMTVEFYSADPQTFVALFAADLASEGEDVDAFFEQLKAYPVADFSLHLQTEDLDSLCQSLRKQDSGLPSVFREVLVEQIWEDGHPVTESRQCLPMISLEASQHWINRKWKTRLGIGLRHFRIGSHSGKLLLIMRSGSCRGLLGIVLPTGDLSFSI